MAPAADTGTVRLMTNPTDSRPPARPDRGIGLEAEQRSRRFAITWLAVSAAYLPLLLWAWSNPLLAGVLLWFTWPLPVTLLAVSAVGAFRSAARGGWYYRASLLTSAVPFALVVWGVYA